MTAAVRVLTQHRLQELLKYDPLSGNFYWRVVRGGKRPGDLAGCLSKERGKPYWRIRVDDELIMAHRLAWLYVKGVWPVGEVDHDDGDGLNNRWKNLKEATRLTNNQNASRRVDNSTGVPGVSRVRSGKFAAHIFGGKKREHLGTFETLELAAVARTKALALHGFHPEHGKAPIR